MKDPLVIVAVVLGVVALVLILIMLVVYSFHKTTTNNIGVPLQIINGTSADTSTPVLLDGGEYYIAPIGMTILSLTIPQRKTMGNWFIINNQSNTSTLTITFQPGITQPGNKTIPGGKSAMFVWLDDNGNLSQITYS